MTFNNNHQRGIYIQKGGLAVKGAIFHQGYNNALGGGSAGAAMYYQVFGKMITAWREAFGDPGMPFGIISLCTAGKPQSMDDYVERMLDDGVELFVEIGPGKALTGMIKRIDRDVKTIAVGAPGDLDAARAAIADVRG